MKNLVIYPASLRSLGAKKLANALGVKRVLAEGRYTPGRNDAVINWGSSRAPRWKANTVVNHWNSLRRAIDKRNTFYDLYNARPQVPSVPFCYNTDHWAKKWLKEGHIVFARQQVSGTQGAGIVVMKTPEDFVKAPLYTRFEPNCKEYRVHVAFGKVINFQQKKRKNGAEADKYVRSHARGWVFAREGVDLPESTGSVSKAAVEALGLSFGAVDILHNPKTGKDFVLEVNTAPGLDSDHSVQVYVDAFREFAND